MQDYYYGMEGEQFAFFRIPKVLFQDERYKSISAEARILYGLLLDRVTLSLQKGWKDREGRIYIFYTVNEVMESLSCGNKKAIQLMNELENRAGLIERKRQGQGKPSMIYVKNFIRTVDNSDSRHFQKCEDDTSEDVISASLEVSEVHTNNTDKKETEKTNTENSIDPDGGDERLRYEAWFRKSLELDYLYEDYPYSRETIQGIFDLLIETCCSKRKLIRVAGEDKPAETVRSRLMKLNSQHIRYVMESLQNNCTDVRNIRQYLLTSLYNAPVTMKAYYQAKVNHDMYRIANGGNDNAEKICDYCDNESKGRSP